MVPKYLLSGPLAQLVEQLTFNQWVTGSNPVRLTTKINDLAKIKNISKLLGLQIVLLSHDKGVGSKTSSG